MTQITLVATLAANKFVTNGMLMVSVANDITSALFKANQSITKMENTLITSSGSLKQSKIDLDRLGGITDKLGVSFEAAVTPFAKFAAAADELNKDDKFQVFEGFATALSATHAGAQQVSGTFLALQQIMSKGKVNMQDLRRQLAEHIPGAMELARKAYKDGTATQEEFNKAVRDGVVNANTWIVKFAALMEEKFGGAAVQAAQSLNAEMNRMSKAWLLFKNEVVTGSNSVTVWKDLLVQLQEKIFENEQVMSSLQAALASVNQGLQYLIDNGEGIATFFRVMAGTVRLGVEAFVDFGKVVMAVINPIADALKFLYDIYMKVLGKPAQALWNKLAGVAKTSGAKVDKSIDLMISSHSKLEESMISSHETAQESSTIMIDAFKKYTEIVKTEQEELTAKTKTEDEKRYAIGKDVYDKLGLITKDHLDGVRAELKETTEAWGDSVDEATKLKYIMEEMDKVVAGSKFGKDQAKAAADELERAQKAADLLAENERKAAAEAAKLEAEQKKATAEIKRSADAAAKLASNQQDAADAVYEQGIAMEKANAEAAIAAKADSGFSTQGITMSEAEQKLYDSLTTAGSGDHYWNSKPKPQDSLANKQLQKENALAAIYANREAQSGDTSQAAQSINYQAAFNFNQSISRSDVTSIIEETSRIGARA